ncbi:hypothetical protein BJ170DRAFT_67912 [Xylariales sp. AK1849]|nr:hypothetical protein BJ170DRAFT_67912 [Xylariales sp. AK1849]
MGIGNKIKEALSGDHHDSATTSNTHANTSHTPGSYPSEEGHGTQKYGDKYDSSHNTAEPRTEKLPGKHSADYTHGSNTAHLGHDSQMAEGHRDPGLSGTTGATTSPSSHGNKLTKDPYWGEADKSNTHGLGKTGAHGRAGNDLNAHDVNNRYHGSTGREGEQGLHSSQIANAADPRIDSDRDHRVNPGYGSTSTGRNELGYGRTTGQDYDNKYGSTDKALPHRPHDASTTGQGYDAAGNTHNTHSPAAAGVTSGLSQHPYDSNNTHRDHKTSEYDAPTNSSGRGHGGLAGAGTGAAAGYGASQLADKHHEHDLNEYDTRGSSNRHHAHDTTGQRDHPTGTGSSMLDPHDKHSSNTDTGSSMLDPHSKHATTPATGHGLHDHHSSPRDSGFVTGAEEGNAIGGSSEHNVHGGRDNESGVSDKQYGPGHPGAKVMHKCHNCGVDNDITQHFQKDPVYRMG